MYVSEDKPKGTITIMIPIFIKLFYGLNVKLYIVEKIIRIYLYRYNIVIIMMMIKMIQ